MSTSGSKKRGFLTQKGPGTASASEEKEEPQKKEDFFESKLFKLITLGIYLGGVGGMGFVLAVFHLFLWDSTMPPIPNIKHKH